MRRLPIVAVVTFVATACGASQPAAPVTGSEPVAETSPQEPGGGGPARENEFQLQASETAGEAHGEHPSQIVATVTEAAMRLFVVDPETGPIPGIVIKLTGPDGTGYYTAETDAQGYAEVLVPVGQRYDVEYLSLGRRNVSASVQVPPGPNQDIRLTMRYRGWHPPPTPTPEVEAAAPAEPAPRFVLDGVLFESGRDTLDPGSFPRLDRVVEYMTHKPSARIRVAGHTDNVGNPRRNLELSEARAGAVRDYLVSHGIDASRVEAVGFGDQQPVASNDTEAGRAQNRRIEATEL